MSRQQPKASTYTREEFRRWYAAQPGGRYERLDGLIVAMAPERASHVRVKGRVFTALQWAIRATGVRCEAMPDGVTVETPDSDYQPDALVNCGPPMDDDAISAPNPVIIVEVLSPSTASTDTGGKLADYFKIPSVAHYLFVHATKRTVIHLRRDTPDGITTRVMSTGQITLSPPGLTVTVEEFYANPR